MINVVMFSLEILQNPFLVLAFRRETLRESLPIFAIIIYHEMLLDPPHSVPTISIKIVGPP